jgi:hypothetical protein
VAVHQGALVTRAPWYSHGPKSAGRARSDRRPPSDSPRPRLRRIRQREVHRPDAANGDDRGFAVAANDTVIVWRSSDPVDEATGNAEPARSTTSHAGALNGSWRPPFAVVISFVHGGGFSPLPLLRDSAHQRPQQIQRAGPRRAHPPSIGVSGHRIPDRPRSPNGHVSHRHARSPALDLPAMLR